MNTVLDSVQISPVNMDDRKQIGIRAGDTVRVHQKIQDKGKTRIQIFEGLVLARKHGNEPGATFTVRKVVRRSKVRRAKLYYIREKVAREIKRQMRKMHFMGVSTESDIEVAARAEEEAKRAEEEAAKKAEEEAKKAEEEKAATEASAEEEKKEEEQTDAVEEEKKD